MVKNLSETQSGSFEKGERIRFEDLKVGMIVSVKITNADKEQERLEGVVESLITQVKPEQSVRPQYLDSKSGFYISLKDGTQRVVREDEVKEIEFRGYSQTKTVVEVAQSGADIAPGLGREKLADRLREVFRQKHGRNPTDAELEALIKASAQAIQELQNEKAPQGGAQSK